MHHDLRWAIHNLLDSEAYNATTDLHSLCLVHLELNRAVLEDKSAKLRQVVLKIVAVSALYIILEDSMTSAN